MRIPFVGPIAGLVGLHFLLWFICFQVVGFLMKMYGYPLERPLSSFSTEVQFFRQWGAALLLIPIAWGIWATWDFESNAASNRDLGDHVMTGIVLLLFASVYFTIACLGAIPGLHM